MKQLTSSEILETFKDVPVFLNSSEAELIEHALKADKNTLLSSKGSLRFLTGKFTGRAADDKYVVEESYSKKVIDWKNNIKSMTPETFQMIKTALLEKMSCTKNPIYITDASAGANPKYNLGIKLITTSAAHAIFGKIIFRKPQDHSPLGHFTIYHDPSFTLDIKKYPIHSPTVITINFLAQEIIIIGTGYTGEIKKSIFSVLNTLLPDLGVLPMHTGANQDSFGKTSLFFGLSGTGKTTLSTDEGVDIIGDDEHGLSDEGIFNFEGGCYAKTNGLSEEREADIFKAVNQFKSLLENVVLDPVTRAPLYNDISLTENGRATYSLQSLAHIEPNSRGAVPSNIFFLSADAMGVLPAVSLLTPEQSMYYFLSGYTAKLAGTEIGLKGVTAAFSHCFGAPFMMRHAKDYGRLLEKYLTEYKINVWLINTGWYGGIYGEGKRYPLSFTRSCIRAIQKGTGDLDYKTNEILSLKIPKTLGDVDKNLLDPETLWKDASSYSSVAQDLKNKFEANFKKFNNE